MTTSDAAAARGFRYYDLLVGGMVAVLLCSNLIGPAKVSAIELPWIGALSFGTGNLFFPIGYIFGDVLTEVYGYARARRAIWAGFGAMAFATVMAWAVIHMPPSEAEPFNRQLQPALALVFGGTARIALASMIGYWVGDFVNAFVMARLKLLTNGRHLWTRTIGSTIVGQACDSLTFYPIAFYGIWQSATLAKVIVFNWTMKVAVEVVLTPVTYAVVGWLKRAEGVDTFDCGTHFNPFSLRDDGQVLER
ncbi:queuosine precursor transporter [Frateuria defendens]|uniref:queuosine precursor transporter n=1 Tax=Frateuria defendens TaxID=2219559 RepID=UPI00066FE818|nr:queuosine precursor transporter [Frateuria defendens]